MPIEDWLPSTPITPSCFVCNSTEHATMDHPRVTVREAFERMTKRRLSPHPHDPVEWVSPEEYERRRRER